VTSRRRFRACRRPPNFVIHNPRRNPFNQSKRSMTNCSLVLW
jgi:hypothetical protein